MTVLPAVTSPIRLTRTTTLVAFAPASATVLEVSKPSEYWAVVGVAGNSTNRSLVSNI